MIKTDYNRVMELLDLIVQSPVGDMDNKYWSAAYEARNLVSKDWQQFED